MRAIVAWSFVAALSLGACTEAGSSEPPPQALSEVDASRSPAPSEVAAVAPAYQQPLRFVALGDGYTAGASTAAPNRDSWPAQLQQVMSHSDTRLRLISNLARPGDTSKYVLTEQLRQVESLQPDVVTLQVGGNDSIDSVAIDDYRDNLEAIFVGLLQMVPANRIFAITAPNHEITARGRDWTGKGGVAEFNATLEAVAAAHGIVVVDISPVYEAAATDPSLILHGGPWPSARQYAGWVELIGQKMRHSLTVASP